MNLEGQVVKFNVSGVQKDLNNFQDSCPAIVTKDWNPEFPLNEKLLNLKVLFDGEGIMWLTSICHAINPGLEYSWQLYQE